ncbi:rhomboid family intramembrane serine protease [Pseudogracilibacillus sp. SE30717A]|uniref:rhomboid family intramembrane serine protease n=1 Tax=Pseudogracilibacillus sp. SE30717A TaxID=3098293 RepID=UPI00300E0D7E
MFITEQYYMYQLADDLIKNDQYEMLHLNPTTDEVWLEKYEKNVSKVIRLIHKGFDWKNHLKSDVTSVFQRVQTMKQFLIGKNIEIYNVYVASHEPVDDWEILKKPMQLKAKKPLKMKLFYLTEENYSRERARLLEQVNSTAMEEQSLLPEFEQENAVAIYKMKLSKLLREKNNEMEKVFTYGKPIFTYVFIVLNLFMFLMLEINGGSTNIENLIQSGAKYNPAIIHGEWWRIVTSMFLHIGPFHLFMNIIALYYLGMTVERIFGSVRFIIIYFLAGVGGGLASFAFNSHVSAGASGALFGLFGALLFFGFIYKKLFLQTMGKSLIVILVINLAIGIALPQIDMGAHIGGLIMGFITSAITYVPAKQNRFIQLSAFIIYITFTVLLISIGFRLNSLI